MRATYLYIALLAPLLCSCSGQKELESGLDSKQSIEIMVVLSRSDIAAERERLAAGQRELYRILVPTRNYQQALELLHEHGLPQTTEQDFEQLTRPQGFVPSSPEIAQLRSDYALSLRVEQLLSALPSVLDVKAIIRTPSVVSRFGPSKDARPTASIVIRHSSGADALVEDDLRAMIMQAVPGMDPESVQIAFSPVTLSGSSSRLGRTANGESGEIVPLAQLRPFFVFRVPEEDLDKATKQLLLYTVAFCFAGIVLGAVWTSLLYKRRLASRRRRGTGEQKRSLFIEAGFGSNVEGGERLLPQKGKKNGKPQPSEG